MSDAGRRPFSPARFLGEAEYAESLAIPDAAIVPSEYRVFRLVQEHANGYRVEADFLRTLDWVGVKQVGERVELDLPEMGATGEFQLMAIEPCVELEAGAGRLVTGEFRFSRGFVYNLRVAGEPGPIQVTEPYRQKKRNSTPSLGRVGIAECPLCFRPFFF